MKLTRSELKELLDEAYDRLATPAFIANDPLSIPNSFSQRVDIEISAFLTATISWGQRKTIIDNAWRLVRMMDGTPHAFVMNSTTKDLARLDDFVHRTFNGTDARQFILSLRQLYGRHGGLENAFLLNGELRDMGAGIALFKERFFQGARSQRTLKHVADPSRGSHAKRINMFLRWMVRPNDRGIDLGLWKRITPAKLHVPLDVHTGRVARELGLLKRSQDDWKSVIELTEQLRKLDQEDPIKYDIALFGLGVEGQRANSRRAIKEVPRSSVARRK